MKTDIYTKTVLTVIAACLIILAAKCVDAGFLVSTAHAQTKNVMDVNIAQIDGEAVNIGVGVKGASLPVNIQRINGEDFGGKTRVREALPVRVQER